MRKRIFAVIFILFLMGMTIAFPSRYLSSVTRGLNLFWLTVLPALFPFFFFTRLLGGLGFPEAVSKVFKKPVRKLFKTPSVSSYVFFMSILSGYPVGAKLVAEFYKKGVINSAESVKIISFCSTSAPIFVIGTIGSLILNNTSYGALILFAHYLSAIITGLIFCNVKPLCPTDKPMPLTPQLSDNLISDSVDNAVLSILSVGGIIAIFSLIIDVLSDLRFFNLFGSAAPFFTGLFEITRGIADITKNPPNIPIFLAEITALVSFGGICIFLQSMSFLMTAKIKATYFFAVKTVQGLFGGLFAYIFALIFF